LRILRRRAIGGVAEAADRSGLSSHSSPVFPDRLPRPAIGVRLALLSGMAFPLTPGRARERGFSLLEALVAMAILLVVAASVSGLFLSARRAAWAAGVRTLATTIAADKMERLASLSWSVDRSGAPVSDFRTDLSTDPPGEGGSGLRASPGGTLARDVAGFADYVDAHGRVIRGGSRVPAGAAFVRRWAIEPLTSDPADSIVLTVLVLPVADAARSAAGWRGAVRIATIRTRTAE
jgi:prepilin-type N-terminal cleavage/methylation domain-containing protein